MRRIRLVEYFPYFVKAYDIKQINNETYTIESYFYRMVIRRVFKRNNSRYELLSFYHYK